jgi:hypothetical protein
MSINIRIFMFMGFFAHWLNQRMLLSSEYRGIAERFLQRFRIMTTEGQTLGMIHAESLGLGAGMARPLSSLLYNLHIIV